MKEYILQDAIGGISEKFIINAEASWNKAKLSRMRKMKALIISAACIALAASMAMASFFWLNKPDGDMTGLTPPNNANGVTPNVTPVLPPDDTDATLSDRVEAGYIKNNNDSDPYDGVDVAINMDRFSNVTDGKVPINVSFGVIKPYNVEEDFKYAIENNTSVILSIIVDGRTIFVNSISTEEFLSGGHFLDRTCFYDENGYFDYSIDKYDSEDTFYIDASELKNEKGYIGVSVSMYMASERPHSGFQDVYYVIEDEKITFLTYVEFLKYQRGALNLASCEDKIESGYYCSNSEKDEPYDGVGVAINADRYPKSTDEKIPVNISFGVPAEKYSEDYFKYAVENNTPVTISIIVDGRTIFESSISTEEFLSGGHGINRTYIYDENGNAKYKIDKYDSEEIFYIDVSELKNDKGYIRFNVSMYMESDERSHIGVDSIYYAIKEGKITFLNYEEFQFIEHQNN